MLISRQGLWVKFWIPYTSKDPLNLESCNSDAKCNILTPKKRQYCTNYTGSECHIQWQLNKNNSRHIYSATEHCIRTESPTVFPFHSIEDSSNKAGPTILFSRRPGHSRHLLSPFQTFFPKSNRFFSFCFILLFSSSHPPSSFSSPLLSLLAPTMQQTREKEEGKRKEKKEREREGEGEGGRETGERVHAR